MSAKAPKATRKRTILEKHGDQREDFYYWLNERSDEAVLDYLKAENAYFEEDFSPWRTLEDQITSEIRARIIEDDQSVPYRKKGFWYKVKYEEGKEYPQYYRRPDKEGSQWQLILDLEREAEGQNFCALGGLNISPDNQWLAYGIDFQGRRQYQIRFRDLGSGKELALTLNETTGSGAFSADGQYFFYTGKDATLRPAKVYKIAWQADNPDPELVYEETDKAFNCGVYRGKSEQFLMIASQSSTSSEYRFLPADQPKGKWEIFARRRPQVEYSISHHGDYWYIRSNENGAQNFKLMRRKIGRDQNSEVLIPERENTYLGGLAIFEDYLVINERTKGLNRLRIRPWNRPEEEHYLPIESETYQLGFGNNPEFDTPWLRYYCNGMTTPPMVVDYHLETREKKVLKQVEVKGGYSEDEYASERLWANAHDGTQVPISLVYRKDQRRKEGNPLLLYGYGSYGITVDPGFSSARLSLLDRGFIFAIAHVRGGQYLGRQWYEDGKLKSKKNTFSDFIACGQYLTATKWASRDQLFAMGGSAGGLLVGAVINEAPQMWRGAVAAVPFVDVVTTMLDDSVPLTTGEYEEWGNPNEEDYYRYMLSYSPYDQVKAQKYPALLITAGLHDSQVQYWEPAKWCAKLRYLKTDDQPLYLYTNMESGHGGASGRFESIRELAREYAFLISQSDKAQ